MIISTFKRHGAETIDTPVFELKEVREGFKKTYWGKVWSFAKPGGVSGGGEKTKLLF